MLTVKEQAAWEGVETQRDYAATFLVFIASLFGIAILIGALAVGNDYDCADGTVIVQPGDTLWSIVEEHCEGDVRAAVTAFDVSTFTLQPGQELVLP